MKTVLEQVNVVILLPGMGEGCFSWMLLPVFTCKFAEWLPREAWSPTPTCAASADHDDDDDYGDEVW